MPNDVVDQVCSTAVHILQRIAFLITIDDITRRACSDTAAASVADTQAATAAAGGKRQDGYAASTVSTAMHIQKPLLLNLALVAQMLHQQQQGLSPALAMAAAPSGGTSHQSDGRQQQQQLQVPPQHKKLLITLGVSDQLDFRKIENLDHEFLRDPNHQTRVLAAVTAVAAAIQHDAATAQPLGASSCSSSSGSGAPAAATDLLSSYQPLLLTLIELQALQPFCVFETLPVTHRFLYHMIASAHNIGTTTVLAAKQGIAAAVVGPAVEVLGPVVLSVLTQSRRKRSGDFSAQDADYTAHAYGLLLAALLDSGQLEGEANRTVELQYRLDIENCNAF